MKYFIHYSGWNKNWDEWVPESRVLKHGRKSAEAVRTSKGQSRAICRGEDERGCSRKEDIWPATEKC
jgi:hypothetical protein